jgi:hypothetical protein
MNASILPRRLGVALGLIAVFAAAPAPGIAADIITISGSDGTNSTTWTDIQNDTYDARAHFATGADRLSARLNEQIRILRAKRAGRADDIKDWDIAIKDVDESRALLTSRITELKKATTPEMWIDDRDKVGEAWKRSQLAVDKMNTTVTS